MKLAVAIIALVAIAWAALYSAHEAATHWRASVAVQVRIADVGE